MTAVDFWFVNTVTVATYLGTKNGAPSYGAPQTITCWVDDETKLVRDTSGAEVVSQTTVYAPIALAGLFAPGSKVTTADGRTAFVISAARQDSGTLALGLDHVQVTLT